MPIQEKPVRLEFSFVPEGGSDSNAFHIVYDKQHEEILVVVPPPPLPTMELPVELFVEVVDFLRSKGVVEGLAPSVRNPAQGSVLKPLPIALPVIEKKDSVPFSSFNSEQDSVENKKTETKVENDNVEETKKEAKKEGIYVDGKKVEDKEIKNRPVIKAKTATEGDMLRGGIADSDKHSIRSQHR